MKNNEAPILRPYSGLKVLDVTRVLASPFASYMLGLLGATVIKIEDPEMKGDTMRHRGGGNAALYEQGLGTAFMAQNSNKQSLTLNLRLSEGQAIFKQLVTSADIVIENLRGGKMSSYGLDYPSLKLIKDNLIYCSLTGYGQNGEKGGHPAYDSVIQAASGIMSLTGTSDTGPMKVGIPLVDYSSGFATAFAIASAVVHRERTGFGQYIDVSMLDTALVLMSSIVTDSLTLGNKPKAHGNSSGPGYSTNQAYRVGSDLLWICASESHQRERLWQVLDRPDIPLDPRFNTQEKARENITILQVEIEKTLSTKTVNEWEFILNEAGVPAMRVRTVPEILDEPHVKSRGLFHQFNAIPGAPLGVSVPLLPFQMSLSPGSIQSAPPVLGQDTDSLLNALGFDDKAIKRLRERKVI